MTKIIRNFVTGSLLKHNYVAQRITKPKTNINFNYLDINQPNVDRGDSDDKKLVFIETTFWQNSKGI